MAFGGPNLLENVSFEIESGERVCLVGRNGSGKSTCMNLVNGNIKPDLGEIYKQPGSVIAYLDQNIDNSKDLTVYSYVVKSFGKEGLLINEYHELSIKNPESDRFAEVSEQLEIQNAWNLQQRIEDVLTRLKLPKDDLFSSLSGGLKRRASLARTLVKKPDLLLLDEPTNHLDIESIEWMEDFLVKNRFTLFFVTHDRSFLENLATRIIEIDRGIITNYPGNFETYQKRKQRLLAAEEKQNANFDKKLANEEAWIRKGIRARRTRNEGRVRALKNLREERRARRSVQGNVVFQTEEASRSGDIVLVAKNLHFSWADKTVIKNFSTTIYRKDRIAIIGSNGCGKSTLIKLLLGNLEAQSGEIKKGSNLQIAYFDQHREFLDENVTLFDTIGNGSDKVTINGNTKAVISYLGDFLFTPDRVWSPVKSLSGGEKNRLLLAKLFTTPSNFLILDEPTNDLDSETLELLEEVVENYPGTVLLVSHDRKFIDNVATGSIIFDGNGLIHSTVGGYTDWLTEKNIKVEEPKNQNRQNSSTKLKTRKLTNKERQDLKELPNKLEALEQEKSQLELELANPNIYIEKPEEISKIQKKISDIEEDILSTWKRWEEVEQLANEIGH